MLATKVIKRYSNRRSLTERIVLSVTIYSVNTTTKRKEGYCTTYYKLPGKQIYGVLKSEFYKDGKLSGTQIEYCSDYPHLVDYSKSFFTVNRVLHYTNGILDGIQTKFDVKSKLPKCIQFFNMGTLEYSHSFGNTYGKGSCIFRMQKYNVTCHRLIDYDTLPGMGFVVMAEQYKLGNKRKEPGTVNTGHQIRKLWDGNQLITTIDLWYNRYGIKINGFEVCGHGRNVYTAIDTKFTRHAISTIGLGPTAFAVKKEEYWGNAKYSSFTDIYTTNKGTDRIKVGFCFDRSSKTSFFRAVGKNSSIVRNVTGIKTEPSSKTSIILYTYLLTCAC